MQNLELSAAYQRIAVLEGAIKLHRDQKADDRCIEDDDLLYDALGDGIKCDRQVGSQAAMLLNCQRFIRNRTCGGKWPSYAELELKIVLLTDACKAAMEELHGYADSGGSNKAEQLCDYLRRAIEAS